MTVKHIIVSLSVVLAGLLGAQSITWVDQELRVSYAEYTLAATSLGHIHGELIRYRTSVIRAIEADSRETFERIAASLPDKLARINASIDRFEKVSQSMSSNDEGRVNGLSELRDVKAKLDEYVISSREITKLLARRWQVSTPIEAKRLRDEAERIATIDSGMKFIAITKELDQLLDVVVEVAGEFHKEADRHVRLVSTITIGVSLGLAGLVLVL